MARIVTGIDLGLRNAKLLRGHTKGNSFRVTGFAVLPLESKEIADGWAGLAPPFKPGSARIGLTGRDVNIRYTRVPRVPDWQLRNLMRFEVEEIGDQSGSGVASGFNLRPQLPGIEGEGVGLLAIAREGLVEAHAARAAVKAAAGQLLGLLQSTVLFCKSQIKISSLKLDRVLLCGGGAALAGLPQYLQGGLAVPVEYFDPFRVVDSSGLAPAEQQE